MSIDHPLILKLTLPCNRKSIDYDWKMIKCYYWEAKLKNVIMIQCSTASAPSFMIKIFCDETNESTITFIEEFFCSKLEKIRVFVKAIPLMCEHMHVSFTKTKLKNKNVRSSLICMTLIIELLISQYQLDSL